MKSIVLAILLSLSGFLALAQSGAFIRNAAMPTTSAESPLDGNWEITGSRELKRYPAISMLIHVNGKQVYGAGEFFTVCSNSLGSFGGRFHLSGEIEPDNSFTLHSPSLPFVERLAIAGKVPHPGSMSWNGTYDVKNPAQTQCVFDQEGTFSSSRLPTLTGTFSGQVMRMTPMPLPPPASPEYMQKTSERLNISVTVAQGGLMMHERKVGQAYASLPLLPVSGTIRVVGCPCFSQGASVGEFDNSIQGDLVLMKFKMDDESELSVDSHYTSPETGLTFHAHVNHGKCADLGFTGTLSQE